jgi:hypothetical protein
MLPSVSSSPTRRARKHARDARHGRMRPPLDGYLEASAREELPPQNRRTDVHPAPRHTMATTATLDSDSTGGPSGGCGRWFDPAASWASPINHGTSRTTDEHGDVSARATGIVAPEVDTIAIDFITDTTTISIQRWVAHIHASEGGCDLFEIGTTAGGRPPHNARR